MLSEGCAIHFLCRVPGNTPQPPAPAVPNALLFSAFSLRPEVLPFPFVDCPSLPTSLQQGSGFQCYSINDPSALTLPSHSHVTGLHLAKIDSQRDQRALWLSHCPLSHAFIAI